MKLKLGAVAAAVACAVVIVQSAAAVPPTQQTTTTSSTSTIPAGSLCEFPIVFGATVTRAVTTFFNQDGSIRARHTQAEEQDTFAANGKTLVGDPYHFTVIRAFENGVASDTSVHGVSEKVHLPDGGVFIVAGSLHLSGSGAGTFFTVDKGSSGNNIDAFCAALS